MAYRFTNTDKWSDAWFSELKPNEKLLFNYLCDNCDIAGFIELTPKKYAYDIGTDLKTIKGALEGLQRGLTYSENSDCLYINNFLKHQKNIPLNENNKAHVGIIKRFNIYSQKFNIQSITDFIEGASKGLHSPIGIGIGNGVYKDTKQINIEFQIFWDLYDKKIGKLEDMKKKWESLKNSERELIMQYIPKYKLAEPNKKFRKNPESFFNQRAWNNEIISDSEFKKENLDELRAIRDKAPNHEKKLLNYIGRLIADSEHIKYAKCDITAQNMLRVLQLFMNLFPGSMTPIDSYIKRFDTKDCSSLKYLFIQLENITKN